METGSSIRELLPLQKTLASVLRAALIAVLIIQLVIPFSPSLLAQPPVAALTFDAILNDLQSKLGALLNQAQSTGTTLTLVVGAQLTAEIDLVREEFHTELTYQEAQLSADAAAVLDNMRQTLTNLENGTFAKAQDLVNQLQLVVLSLPFSNQTSQLRAFSPYVAAVPPAGVDDLVFTAAGIFPSAGTPKYNPTMTFNGKPYTAANVTAFQATFHVPKTDLTFPNGHVLQSIPTVVTAPYSKRCWLFFHCKKVREYPELVGLLPESPGNLHLSISNLTQKTDTNIVVTPHRNQGAGGGDDPGHPQAFPADSGWEIVPGSVHITVDHAEGDYGVDFNTGDCSTQTMACWKVTTTQHHCVAWFCPQGHDGSVDFHLTFSETKTENVMNNWDGDITDIGWNRTKLEALPSAGVVTFAGTYTDFNGRTYAFGSNNTSVDSPYFKVTSISPTSLAFSFYPFSVDAGSDTSDLASNPKYSKILSALETTNGLLPNHNLNPLTVRGFNVAKGFLALAVDKNIASQDGGQPAHLGNLQVAADVIVLRAGPPPPPTPQEKTFQEIQSSMNSKDHM